MMSGGSGAGTAKARAASLFPHPVQHVEAQHQEEALKWIEDAGEEENAIRERCEVQEGETPSCPEEAAEAPDTEKCDTVLLPFVPGVNLPVDQD